MRLFLAYEVSGAGSNDPSETEKEKYDA